MNINMWELLITALVSILGTGITGWLVFFKWKKGALIAKLRKETFFDKAELLDVVDQKIEKLAKKIEAQRDEILKSRDREFQMKSDLGVLFRSCHCNETEEVLAIRKRYEGEDQKNS